MKKFLTILVLLLPAWAGAADLRQATFAAGCFWCMEAIFERVPSVTGVISGYAGGKEENPTYEQVGSGKTGHAETVEITYDAEKTTYSALLAVFWKTHDPTDGRGVAPDFGSQYRSILFYRTPEEKRAIDQSREELEKRLGKKVATQIVPFEKFWPAEAYHQDYVKHHPNDPYVRNVSIPRLLESGFKE